MGVKGLTTFVDENQHLLSEVRLHDTRLLMDGNNVYYFLYYYFNLSHRYGGNYNDYADKVRYFFNAFHACGIEPYVILDGAIDVDDRKLKTCLRRAKERVKTATTMAETGNGKILPLLAYDTFRCVMKEMNIHHAMCNFEADSEMAALAQHWGCPVLSNDSDFFIFDLKGGCVVLDYLNLQVESHVPSEDSDPQDHAYKYLTVQVYYLDKFIVELNSADRYKPALLATLLGNDIVDPDEFETFFAGAILPKASSKTYKSAIRFRKIIRIIQWLRKMSSFDIALKGILKHYPDKKALMEKKVRMSVDSYINLRTSLPAYFEKSQPETTNEVDDELQTYTRETLPNWFIKCIRSGNVPRMAINIAVHHREIMMSQVEITQQPSCFTCSRHLRSIIYGIIFRIEKTGLPIEAKSRDNHVQEFDREIKHIKGFTVLPTFELKTGFQVPSLQDIPHLSLDDRIAVLTAALQVEENRAVLALPDDVKLFVAVVIYWIKNSRPLIPKSHMLSLLVCFTKLCALEPLCRFVKQSTFSDTEIAHRVSSGPVSPSKGADDASDELGVEETPPPLHGAPSAADPRSEVGAGDTTDKVGTEESTTPLKTELFKTVLKEKCPIQNVKAVLSILRRFSDTPKHNYANGLLSESIHAFSQFQTCLQAAMHLNQILCYPFQHPNPAHIYCGTFLYNLSLDLIKRRNAELYVKEHLLLGKDKSPLAVCYEELYSAVCTSLSEDSFLATSGGKKKAKKSKSKKAKYKKTETGKTMSYHGSDSDSDSDDPSASQQFYNINCDTTNRFHGLSDM